MASPPFCDPHFHMDATLSLGMQRVNVSGTLLEGIALWGELRPLLTKEALVERALRYCDLAASQGLLFLRSHVDTSDPRLVTAEAPIPGARTDGRRLNVSFGQDCTMHPRYSMGSADMLEVGHMAIHVAQTGAIEDMKKIFEALTVNSARTMGFEGYGLQVGCKADLIVLQTADVIEALRLKPTRLAVVKTGKLISRSAPQIGELSLRDGLRASIRAATTSRTKSSHGELKPLPAAEREGCYASPACLAGPTSTTSVSAKLPSSRYSRCFG